MKTTWQLGVMTVNYKLVLLVLGVMLFAGLTGCDRAEKAMDEVSQASTQAIETVKDKAATAMTNEEKSSDEGSEKEGDDSQEN